MEKLILQSESPSSRIQHLKDAADKIEMFSFPRELDPGEIQELQSHLSQEIALEKLSFSVCEKFGPAKR